MVALSPFGFTKNKGQLLDVAGNKRSELLYKSETKGWDVYLKQGGFSYVLSKYEEVAEESYHESTAKLSLIHI